MTQVTVSPRSAESSSGPTRASRRRPDIQALRAFAVLAVVANHLAPEWVPGGYIGVDVFFVISGFLIGSHLLREVESTGRIRLGAFWARRARRLLPASFLVLAVIAVATWIWAPQTEWQNYFLGIAASAAYVVNWLLAAQSVDYLAAESDPSPVQHYWSLAVEEQFYLVWPIIIVIVALIAARLMRNRLAAIGGVIALITLGSFVVNIVWTATDPNPAYFATPVRGWEFGAGAIVAVIAARWRPTRAIVPVQLLASIALFVVAFLYTRTIEFPGWYALAPVAATAAVILFGGSGSSFERATDIRPVQWVGDVSYSLYLWHWPLIVFYPLILGHDFGVPGGIVLLVIALVLAGLTARFVESPFRRSPRIVEAPLGRQFAVVAAGMAVLIGASAITWTSIEREITHSLDVPAEVERSSCFGAAAADNRDTCTDDTPNAIYPDRLAGQHDAPLPDGRKCRQLSTQAAVRACVLVDGGADAVKVALVGDSHAEQWAPALTKIAKDQGWTLVTYLKGGCAFSAATRTFDASDGRGSCQPWNDAVLKKLQTEDFDLIVTSRLTGEEYVTADGRNSYQTEVAGLAKRWKQAEQTGATVVAIRDTPVMGENVPNCLASLGDAMLSELADCAQPERDVLHRDAQVDAAKAANVALIDLSDLFCWDGTCPAVIGSVIVYRDKSHIGGLYSRTLAPYLVDTLTRSVAESSALK